jgi:hypothetical protein
MRAGIREVALLLAQEGGRLVPQGPISLLVIDEQEQSGDQGSRAPSTRSGSLRSTSPARGFQLPAVRVSPRRRDEDARIIQRHGSRRVGSAGVQARPRRFGLGVAMVASFRVLESSIARNDERAEAACRSGACGRR